MMLKLSDCFSFCEANQKGMLECQTFNTFLMVPAFCARDGFGCMHIHISAQRESARAIFLDVKINDFVGTCQTNWHYFVQTTVVLIRKRWFHYLGKGTKGIQWKHSGLRNPDFWFGGQLQNLLALRFCITHLSYSYFFFKQTPMQGFCNLVL